MQSTPSTPATDDDRLSEPFRRTYRRVAIALITVVAIVFSGLRAVYLTADFPRGITISGDLYTDEGWYNNAAISLHLLGRWYTPGDFNPIVNLPLFQIIQAAVTGIFGLNLVSARMTIVFSFVGIAVLAYRLIVGSFGVWVALLALLLLATNMLLFAYSRFAIIELPMTLLALAAVVAASANQPRTRNVVIAACCLCLALLMKTSAIFVIPAVVLLVWTNNTTTTRKFANLGIVAAGVGVALAYHLIARATFPADYALFDQRNIADRVTIDVADIVHNIRDAVREGQIIDRIAYVPTLVFAPLLWITFHRRSRVISALIVWSMSYLALLSLTPYHPARYYVPLAVPLMLLFAISISSLWALSNWRPSRRYSMRLTLSAFVVLVLGFNAIQVIDYIRTPRFTWIDMARDIQQRIATSDRPDGILMGDIANSISLATAQPSINATWGTQSVAWKLEQYQPAFYVVLGQDRSTRAIIEANHDLVLLQSYDVLDNYHRGERVLLYAIRPPTNNDLPTQRGEQE